MIPVLHSLTQQSMYHQNIADSVNSSNTKYTYQVCDKFQTYAQMFSLCCFRVFVTLCWHNCGSILAFVYPLIILVVYVVLYLSMWSGVGTRECTSTKYSFKRLHILFINNRHYKSITEAIHANNHFEDIPKQKVCSGFEEKTMTKKWVNIVKVLN